MVVMIGECFFVLGECFFCLLYQDYVQFLSWVIFEFCRLIFVIKFFWLKIIVQILVLFVRVLRFFVVLVLIMMMFGLMLIWKFLLFWKLVSILLFMKNRMYLNDCVLVCMLIEIVVVLQWVIILLFMRSMLLLFCLLMMKLVLMMFGNIRMFLVLLFRVFVVGDLLYKDCSVVCEFCLSSVFVVVVRCDLIRLMIVIIKMSNVLVSCRCLFMIYFLLYFGFEGCVVIFVVIGNGLFFGFCCFDEGVYIVCLNIDNWFDMVKCQLVGWFFEFFVGIFLYFCFDDFVGI